MTVVLGSCQQSLYCVNGIIRLFRIISQLVIKSSYHKTHSSAVIRFRERWLKAGKSWLVEVAPFIHRPPIQCRPI